MKTTAEKIAVMQAYAEGKQIEVSNYKDSTDWGLWTRDSEPYWDWITFDYRVTVTKPSINPDHVHKDYNWLATNSSGVSYLYKVKPKQNLVCWMDTYDEYVEAHMFASFKPGTCDWKDSLVNIREIKNG